MPQGIKNVYHLLVAIFAAIFFRSPAKNLTVIGVTGTDGKTTTVNLIYEILKNAGKQVSMISSVGAKIDGRDYDLPFHVTTPSSWQLQRFLRKIADGEDKGDESCEGCGGVEGDREERYLVLEVTSHALDQNRVLGIPFKIAVLTNITREHLDYHKTFSNYTESKIKLFRGVEWAVINKDFLDNGFKVSEFKSLKVISYGIKTGKVNTRNFPFDTPLPGEFNKLNCLAAIACAKCLGIDDEVIRRGVSMFKGLTGRFEFVETARDFRVVVDFAHTPNALENVLSTIRPMVKSRLIHVFGSAGLRDAGKRPMMGKTASEYDDVMILTEEDYRTEDVNKITEEIVAGIENLNIRHAEFITSVKASLNSASPGTDSGHLPADALPEAAASLQAGTHQALQAGVQDDTYPEVFRIPDRQEAISKAIKMAKKGDWVVLTGKGHERSLCRGKTEYPWSEHDAVEKALKI